MSSVAVSVVIPVYNSREQLEQCLLGLAAQDPRPMEGFEVIVVDDASTVPLRTLVERFPFASYIRQEKAGPAAARNLGAEQASSSILAFIDADCVPATDWLVELLAPFSDPEVAGVQGVYTTHQRSLVARFAQLEIEQRYSIMRRKSTIAFIGTYCAAYRRAVFMQFDGFDPSFPRASGEDADFSFKLEEAGHRLVLAPGAVVAHKHPDSVWAYLKQKFGRAWWRNLLYRKHRGKMIQDTYTPHLLKLQVGMMGLLLPGLALSIAWSPGWYVARILVVIFLGLTIPDMAFYCKRSLAIGLISPFLLFGRAAALACGMALGFVFMQGGSPSKLPHRNK
jgi:glycosyltransferase involved in cell wall biosynthesis